MLSLADCLIYNRPDSDDTEPICAQPNHEWDYVRKLRRGHKFLCSHCALVMVETTIGPEYH